MVTQNNANFFVVMQEKADLSPAYQIADWDARGQYVYDTLREVARRSQAAYRTGFGVVTQVVDMNGNVARYDYDAFGRLLRTILPGDTLAQPTQAFEYQLGSPRSAITTHQREQSGSDQVLTSVTYYDGLGRALQTRSEAADGQVVAACQEPTSGWVQTPPRSAVRNAPPNGKTEPQRRGCKTATLNKYTGEIKKPRYNERR